MVARECDQECRRLLDRDSGETVAREQGEVAGTHRVPPARAPDSGARAFSKDTTFLSHGLVCYNCSMQKKIVVTGGAGFIGSHLAEKLLSLDFEVHVIDDFNNFYDPELKEQNIHQYSINKSFHVYRNDITHAKELLKIFEFIQPECVIHLAARAGVRPSLEQPALYSHVNILGTLNVLEASKKVGVTQFIFGSSSSVYGNSPEIPFSEDNACDAMISPYAVTKRSAELFCKLYAENEKIPTTCLRFFTVYGPRQRPDLAIHSFMQKIATGETISMFGDGSSARDYTYIDDIVDGIVAAINKPLDFEIINLGNSHPIQLKDMIAEIEKAMGKKAIIETKPMQKGDVEKTFANIEKAKKLLDWEPKTSFSDGIQKMAEWYNTSNA
jgi:UDP-glucuronate 4-epimerase